LLSKGALGLFPKGQDVASELTEAAKYWKIDASLIASRTDEKAQIIVVKRLEPLRGSGLQKAPNKGHGSHER
jgi:16S rRNA (guanine527-N7)-methyltransferase